MLLTRKTHQWHHKGMRLGELHMSAHGSRWKGETQRSFGEFAERLQHCEKTLVRLTVTICWGWVNNKNQLVWSEDELQAHTHNHSGLSEPWMAAGLHLDFRCLDFNVKTCRRLKHLRSPPAEKPKSFIIRAAGQWCCGTKGLRGTSTTETLHQKQPSYTQDNGNGRLMRLKLHHSSPFTLTSDPPFRQSLFKEKIITLRICPDIN